MDVKNIGTYIACLRDQHNFSRAKLATLTGTSEMSIGRIEQDGQEPKAGLFIRLMKALGGSWDTVVRLESMPDDDDYVRQLVADAFAPTPDETPDEAARLNRLLDLLEQGVPPDEAARRARRG